MILKIIIAIVVIVLLVMAVAMVVMTKGMGQVKDVNINEVDLSKVADGTYQGSFSGARWSNEVEVTVENNRITAITVTTPPKFFDTKFSDSLVNNIIEKQSLDVDIVSGATITSKAILKSIENALSN